MVIVLAAVMAGSSCHLPAQHSHINAGAFSPNQDAQLYFVNGDFFVTNSGYVVPLSHTNTGNHAGLYQGGITFTALPASYDTGGPAFGHAALGSQIALQVVSAQGPRQAEFGMWEFGQSSPEFTIATETVDGTNQFLLSEDDGSPGTDPFGHIHGRRFTATKPGLYTLGFRIRDVSSNGTGGSPVHSASDIFYLYFQAGLTVNRVNRAPSQVTVEVGTWRNHSYYLETSPQLGPEADWSTVAGPLSGNSHIQTLTDTGATNQQGFYRLRRTSP